MLLRMDSLCGKPVCLWLPERFKKPNTSTYVQGVEGLTDYTGPVSEGFDVIELPTADYLMFQGEPFAEEDYCDAISAVQQAMNGVERDNRMSDAIVLIPGQHFPSLSARSRRYI